MYQKKILCKEICEKLTFHCLVLLFYIPTKHQKHQGLEKCNTGQEWPKKVILKKSYEKLC